METELAAEAAAHASGGVDLTQLVALLGAAVIAVPISKRLGLGTVLGYLVAGIIIGPFGFAVFQEPEAVLHVAELGVVLLLFVIGLEMKPSRLWTLRRDIFGLGLVQVLLAGAVLTAAATFILDLDPIIAFVAAMGFVMSSTAIVVQILEERGETLSPRGQKIVSILLLEDLAIVPLLALVAFLAPGDNAAGAPIWVQLLTAVGAVLGVIFAGRRVLTPLFRVIASTRAREIMTAAALLVVLGAAMALEAGGLSMAMGAFLAGVVLSDSSFRHQLEADIEPFRGLLLGLFFLAVGMSLDLGVVATDWPRILATVAVLMVLKAAVIYGLARVLKSSHGDGLHRALLMAQGGEFAFVLYTVAGGNGLMAEGDLAILTAAVITSMAITPLAPLSFRWLLPKPAPSLEGVSVLEGELHRTAIVIGFGRFGQVVSQFLLARGISTTIIDADPDMIRNAARFGFKIYYGDGTRLDVLRAAGADSARIICVCVDNKDATNLIVDVAAEEFSFAQLYVRSYDRGHTIALRQKPIAFEIRETVESAIVLGEASLIGLGFTPDEAAETAGEIRRRDLERLKLQQAEGLRAGGHLVYREPLPTPLLPVRTEAQALSAETAVLAQQPADPEKSDG